MMNTVIDSQMKRWNLPVFAMLLIGLCVAGLGGCAVAPMAGDAAGTVIEQTGEALRLGKFETFEKVGKDELVAKVRKAAQELEFKPVREEKHPDQLKLIYKDDRDQEIVVNVVYRSGHMTELRLDVGLFGPEAMGNLMLREILEGLPGVKAVKR